MHDILILAVGGFLARHGDEKIVLTFENLDVVNDKQSSMVTDATALSFPSSFLTNLTRTSLMFISFPSISNLSA